MMDYMTNLQFNTFLGRAIEIWAGYDNAHNYALGKISRIIGLTNSEDSILLIFGMFDGNNQAKLIEKLDPEVAGEVIKIYRG